MFVLFSALGVWFYGDLIGLGCMFVALLLAVFVFCIFVLLIDCFCNSVVSLLYRLSLCVCFTLLVCFCFKMCLFSV